MRVRRSLPPNSLVLILALALPVQAVAADLDPSFRPIGRRAQAATSGTAGNGLVSFTSNRGGNNEVYVMSADGSGQADITNNSASDSQPSWSPDGTKIAFTSNRRGNYEVYLMSADGTRQFDLTNNSASDSQPAWSPDGTKIAFTSNRSGDSDIWVMNSDGSGQTDLTNNPASESLPVYSPDGGTRIIFISNRDGNGEVYVMNSLDGTYQTNLTHNSASDSQPNWQRLPPFAPSGSPVQHVVVIYEENHAFDNVLGKLCVTTGRCDGSTTGELADGTAINLPAATDVVPKAAHSGAAQTTAINGGQMNGFSLISGCDVNTGYACYQQYDQPQIPNLWSLASTFAISDRTFEMDTVPSWQGHLELASSNLDGFGATNNPNRSIHEPGPGWGCDSFKVADWAATPFDQSEKQPSCVPQIDHSGPFQASPVPWVPTIMDRMDKAGLSWHLYAPSHSGQGTAYGWAICPTFAGCLYTSQADNVVPPTQVLADAAAGMLPNLSIVIPTDADSQHNGDSMLAGDNWIASVVSAVMSGPEWESSAIFITYDDCGCFYDHVPPPPGLGIRVPMVIVSPYARPGFTDANVASYDSMLAYTEHTFGLAPLSTRDATAYDFSQSFDYTQSLSSIPLTQHLLPAWEQQWLQEHPTDPGDPT
jgi:phospholipase C